MVASNKSQKNEKQILHCTVDYMYIMVTPTHLIKR